MDQPHTHSNPEAVLASHLPMLKGYMRHLVDSAHDADDLAQEVCLEVLKNPAILARGSDTGAYLRGIARHLASRHHRRVQRALVIEEIIDLAWEAKPESRDAEAEQHALRACLELLSEKFRSMIAWRYEDGLNASAIAQRLSSSSEAVRMSLGRARQSLSKCIKQRLTLVEGR